MSNIWFPLPVALFLRRVVNLFSSLSITHHYLVHLPPRSTGADSEKIPQDNPSRSSPWAGRVLQSLNRLGQQETERHVLSLENSLFDPILQGTVQNISLNNLFNFSFLIAKHFGFIGPRNSRSSTLHPRPGLMVT